jgi:hypothetical protein
METKNMESHGEGSLMYVPRMAAILSRWFTTHEDARSSREAEGGYLLPYKNHFFVTTSEAIRELGLDPADPDWARIGWDWVCPSNAEAWQRLKVKRELTL